MGQKIAHEKEKESRATFNAIQKIKQQSRGTKKERVKDAAKWAGRQIKATDAVLMDTFGREYEHRKAQSRSHQRSHRKAPEVVYIKTRHGEYIYHGRDEYIRQKRRRRKKRRVTAFEGVNLIGRLWG